MIMEQGARIVGSLFLSCLILGAEERLPNILFVHLDDFGWKDASFMGSDYYRTPHMDRLAEESMVFTDAYAAAANCAPSRACLLSGLYTPRHRIYNVGTRPRGAARHRRLEHVPGTDVLDPSIRTWAEVAQEAGYRTASIGKWHLSPDPRDHGFDINIGGGMSGSPPRGYYPPHPGAPGLADAPGGEYLTDRLSEEAIGFIRENGQGPWLLYLSHFAVHTPLDAKRELLEEWRERTPGKLHGNAVMGTMIQAVDDGVGRIRQVLEELGLEERTIVILSSDNGGYGPATDMDPLKGYKGTYYEGGIRVPLTVRWPGVTAPGSLCTVPVSGVDLHPTLCAMMGVPRPPDAQDGRDLGPLLRGGTWEERALFWHFPAYLQSYRGVADEQRDPLFRSRPCSIVRRGPWKLHHRFEDGGVELYHLATDIGERYDLSGSHPEKAAALHAELEEWWQTTGADLPLRPNPAFRPD